MSDQSRIEAIIASKQPGAEPYTGVPQSRLEEELLNADFSKPPIVVQSFSEMTEEGQVYVIKNTEEGEYNKYTEYILVNGQPERFGKQDIVVDAYTRAETDSLLDKKVDKETGKGLSTEDFTSEEKIKLSGIEAGAQVNPDLTPYATNESVNQGLSGKVDKETGKGLSTEDFTSEEKTKLSGIESGAQVNPDLTPYATSESVNQGLSAKVDKVSGKGLSSNDYTDAEKEKLAGIAAGADVSPVRSVNGKTGNVTVNEGISTVSVSYTIKASKWNANTYSFENDYPSTKYDIVGVYPLNGVTSDEMVKAWGAAKCSGYSTTNTLVAKGTIPTIDLVMQLYLIQK